MGEINPWAALTFYNVEENTTAPDIVTFAIKIFSRWLTLLSV